MGRWLDILKLRARSLFRKSAVETDLQRELAYHLERQVAENAARGMAPGEARLSARRALDGITGIEEECRDMRQLQQIETITGDLKYAARALARTPGFTAILVLTLALAIGANSAIFSVIEGVLLRPLPYRQPDRIVRIFLDFRLYAKFPLNPWDLRDFRARNRSFTDIAGLTRDDLQLSGSGQPVMLRAFAVTAGYFRVLGFAPARGREFAPADESPATSKLAVLSDRLWRTRFASDPNILGRTIMLNAEPYQIVGVMPPGVQHPGNEYHAIADGDTVDLWVPFPYRSDPQFRGSHYMEAIARLKPGVSAAQAAGDMNAMMAQLAREHEAAKGWHVYLVPLYQEMVGRTQRMLWVLLGAVGLLLLIACVNAANLLLARSSARVREIAVRSALGAARSRIVRQLLTESALIAAAGAALGGVLAIGGMRALVALIPAGFPRSGEIRLDGGLFAFTLLIAVVTGLLFGLAPALSASRADLQQNLREGGPNASSSARHLRLRNLLVIGETALSSVLLIAAGLLLHSFVNLLRTDAGFQPEKVLTASIALPAKTYAKMDQVNRFWDRLLNSIQSIPGVRVAGAGSDLPWTGYNENAGGFTIEGHSQADFGKRTTRYHSASTDYFRALGIPLLQGRFFTEQDTPQTPKVVVINEAMAQKFWPGEDAVGKRFSFSDAPKEKDWMQIVGVVGDVKDQPDSVGAEPGFWSALTQQQMNGNSIVIRAAADESQLVTQLRAAVAALDPGLAVADVKWMEQIADASVARQRFALFLVALFAGLALVLAAIGIYGVISYAVSRRIQEFGMRIALGARPWDVMSLILRQGLRLVLIGAAAGLLAAVGAAKFLESLLYGVKAFDPLTFAAVAVLAVFTAMFACFLPARRATGADPVRLLKSQ